MFTLEQIKAAHNKVKSGMEFPAYIQEIKALGVTHYEAYVIDGHLNYHGINHYSVNTLAEYEPLKVSEKVKIEDFKKGLKSHQQGNTDYLTFIKICAETGIEKWKISMKEMTCTYFGIEGDIVLVEQIPH